MLLSSQFGGWLNNSKALLRMIEAVLAAIIILLAFTVSYHYATPPNPFTIRAKGELEKMAYNLLHRLAEEKALDEILEKNDAELLGNEFAAALRTLLPKNIVYNLTIYKAEIITITPHNVKSVGLVKLCNATNIEDPDTIVRASEVGKAVLTYTYSQLERGEFYTLVLHLTIARVER
jgi:hypothetical protein